jgi:hypothetical protein
MATTSAVAGGEGREDTTEMTMTSTSSPLSNPVKSNSEIAVASPPRLETVISNAPTIVDIDTSIDTDAIDAMETCQDVETFEDEPEEETTDSKGMTAGKMQAGTETQSQSQSPEGGANSPTSSPRRLHHRKPATATTATVLNGDTPPKSPRLLRPRLLKLKLPTPAPRKLVLPPKDGDTQLVVHDDEDDTVDVYGKGNGLRALYSPAHVTRVVVEDNNSPNPNMQMSTEDLEICRRLDEEYERALEEREVGYEARYNSVRQSAASSIAFMLVYMILGTIFFTKVAGWEFHQALFFSVYTITTVGYGSHQIPNDAGFQIYTIFYIFVGIATLTIMVAQVYQCIALVASRAQHSRDKAELARKGRDIRGNSVNSDLEEFQNRHPHTMLDTFCHSLDSCKRFLRDTELGRGVSVICPFAGLILVGAVVVGPIEGWTAVESVYFAVVSLTTLGYGDYVPTKLASVWFTIFWLPFSVGFMSLFLGSVAAFYIRLSDRNIQRLERQMRHHMKRAKEQAEKEQAEALRRAMRGQDYDSFDETANDSTDEEQPPPDRNSKVASLRSRLRLVGFESLPEDDDESEEALFGSPQEAESIGQQRRERILQNSTYGGDVDALSRQMDRTMTTMRDILKTVRRNMHKNERGDHEDEKEATSPANRFMSLKSTTLSTLSHSLQPQVKKKPSFALRCLVQERMAEIIAMDIAGFQSDIEIMENTLSVTIDSLPRTADKWLVPRRARKAFRAVAFEALYFVGEHGLITRGADALLDLTPFEFHRLFSPLLAAMGDADTMEGWLATTNILAEVDLKRESVQEGLGPHGPPLVRARTDSDSSFKLSAADARASSFKTPERLTPARILTVDDGELI